MQHKYLAIMALLSTYLLSTVGIESKAAETCPIFNDISGETEAFPTLRAWSLSSAPPGSVGEFPRGTITLQDAGSVVNIRANAGIRFELLFTAQAGEEIKLASHALSEQCKTWYQVEFNDGRTGWVHRNYVRSERGFGLF